MNEPIKAFENPNQQTYPDDPVSVFLGTGMESIIDMASFGLLQPDIVPDYIEQQHKVAATIGHVAGNVAGMFPSFGAAQGGVKLALKGFGFGEKLIAAAKAGGVVGKAAKVASRPFAVGMGRVASTMMVHDVAREFIRQTKEADPDLGLIGETAVSAAITGGTIGYFGSLTHMSHPLVQANALGSAFSVAEAINSAANGEDVFSTDFLTRKLPTTYLQGFGMALLFNAPGWVGRRNASEKAIIDAKDKYLEEISIKAADGKITYMDFKDLVKKYTGHEYKFSHKDMPEQLDSAISKLKKPAPGESTLAGQVSEASKSGYSKAELREREMNRKAPVGGITPANESGYFSESMMVENIVPKTPSEAQPIQARLHKTMRDFGIPEEKYHEILYDSIGVRSTKGQSKEVLQKASAAFEEYIASAPEFAHIPKFKEPGWLQRHLSDPESLAAATGLKDTVGLAIDAKKIALVEQGIMNNAISVYRTKWHRMYGEFTNKRTPFGQRVKEALTDRTAESDKALSAYNQGKLPTSELTPEMRQLVKDYRQMTDIYWERDNQIRETYGKGRINYVEWYQRKMINVPAMIRAGRASELDFLEYPGIDKTKRAFGQMEVSTEKSRVAREKEPIYVDDPWKALQNMVQYDIKAIHLREPIKLAEAELKYWANKTGADGKPILSQEAVEEGMRILKHVVWGVPTEKSQEWNRWLQKRIESKPGQVIEKSLAQLNIDFKGNPAKALNRFWGSMVSRAYIGLRPRLAIRNSFQVLYTHGFVSTKNLVKGFRDSNDAMLQKIMDESIYHRMNVAQAGEHIGTGSLADKVAFTMYQESHVLNVERTMRSVYFQAMDYIKEDKYKELNWRDPDGKSTELRKTNPGYLSERETKIVKEFVDFTASHTQFLYNAVGLPMVTRSDVAAPIFKLMSYPMNYRYKYLSELWHQIKTGSPSWTKGMENPPKLPWNTRVGLVKHFVGIGLIVGALEQIGLDYSSLLGVYATGKDKPGTAGIPFTDARVGFGVFNMRPSPAMSMLLNIKDAVSGDPYVSEMGRRNLLRNIPGTLPGAGAFTDVKKAVTEGERGRLFTYPIYEKPRKAQPFTSFGGFKAFKSFKSF